MRIYRRKEFMALPAGTLFCKRRDPYGDIFGTLHVKGETLNDDAGAARDFVCMNLQTIEHNDPGERWDRFDGMLERGESYPMNDAGGRDGMFDDMECFLVYEGDDLVKLRGFIDRALGVVSIHRG